MEGLDLCNKSSLPGVIQKEQGFQPQGTGRFSECRALSALYLGSDIPIPVFIFQLQTRCVSAQSMCCRNRNITLILVLRLIKELIKLHTFPKSCLESSQAQSLLSSQKLHTFLHHTKTSNHRISDSSAPADDAPRIHTGFTSNTQVSWQDGTNPNSDSE